MTPTRLLAAAIGLIAYGAFSRNFAALLAGGACFLAWTFWIAHLPR